MVSFSISKLLGVVDKRKGFDWSFILIIVAAAAIIQILKADGCRDEMLDPSKKLSPKCQARVLPTFIIMLIVTIYQFQRLVGKCT